YLPAQDELNLFWNGGAPVAGVLTGAGNWYWSSTEYTTGLAWSQRFSDGFQASSTKDNSHPVRCVRRW
ncbi:MAG: DUF1566 domain-containing protein, partial [Cytophagales bacterium]|nr:DUF1566 domain-containing protein [Cytophagales bacterium]